jgi:threonine aldolase
MLRTSISAPLGDDVFDEDPTVHKLQDHLADMFGKESALWFPTGTQTNLAAIMAHCHERASEIIVGKDAHVTLWEGGNISTIAGVHPRQIAEDTFGRLSFDEIRDQWRDDSDDHWAKTAVRLEQIANLAHASNDSQKDTSFSKT